MKMKTNPVLELTSKLLVKGGEQQQTGVAAPMRTEWSATSAPEKSPAAVIGREQATVDWSADAGTNVSEPMVGDLTKRNGNHTKKKKVPVPSNGTPVLTPADTLLAVTSTPPGLLLTPDPASPTRTEHLQVYRRAGGGYIVARRTEEVGQVVEETNWVCETPEEVEGVLGNGPVAHSLYHLARLRTPCNRHRDGVLNISANALYCAVYAELTHVQSQLQLKEANDSTRRLVAGAWLKIFRQASPGEFRDTGAVRRQMQKLARMGQPVPDWVARMCIYEWRLWHEQRAIEEFDGLGLERSA